MRNISITRRALFGSAAAAAVARAAGEWMELFNGRDLEGWRAGESPDSWKVQEAQLLADGPRSHLYYAGPARDANFRNFELEVEALARPAANSGIYFHTQFQESGFPRKGFEVQINNTATGEGDYRERKKTGSLYGLRNIYKRLVADDEWFRLQVAVRGSNIQVRLNGLLLVDFTETDPPVIAAGNERERRIGAGTFALQCHDPGSKVRFRRIRVRPLEDSVSVPPAPAPDDTYRRIILCGARNIPMVDYHAHLKSGFTVEQLLAKSRRDGLQYGVAVNCGQGFGVQDDEGARRFLESMKGQPVFVAMQAEGREWTRMFSSRAAALFDYVFTDAMTWTDNRGRRMRLWMPHEVGAIADPQEFMDTLVERATGILEREPIDIYVNPTFLPDSIAGQYDALWTDARIGRVVDAAARNGVAIEINDRYELPRLRFLKAAKAAGCKFSFGTNNGAGTDLGRCEYGLRMVEELGLGWKDFFVPGDWRPKAVERKPDALKG